MINNILSFKLKERVKKRLLASIVLSFIVLLSGCGGGGGEVLDTIPPTFTSSATASVSENQTTAITLTATDDNTVTYSISGTDSDSFNLNTSTGVVSFKVAPDYETKSSYSFVAKATDTASNEATQNIQITILDVDETQTTSTLLKTGQTTSYTDYDDGYYEKGVGRNYTRGSDIVQDHVTGLLWQDDTTASTKTWEDARIYCTNLTLGGETDWRLPTRKELVGLSDYGRASPAIDPVFENTISYGYWSSTTYAGGTNDAWSVYFYNGGQSVLHKANSIYVRCVRAGQ